MITAEVAFDANRYKGQWVAFRPESDEVVGFGPTLDAAVIAASKHGVEDAEFYCVPSSDAFFCRRWMTYKYRLQRRGNEFRYLPLIPVELHSSKLHLRVRALFDSGAEHTVFSQQIAHQLGIPLSENRRVMLQAIGGIVPGQTKQTRIGR